MQKQITVTVKFPSGKLLPNASMAASRGSMMQIRRIKKESVNAAWIESLRVCNTKPRHEKFGLHLAFYAPNARRRDPDGLVAAAKTSIDGMVHAGIIADDSMKNIELFSQSFEIDRDNPRMEMIITPLHTEGEQQ